MNERCEKHNQTRCMVCASLERKKPQTFVPSAPPEITGAPPPNIEQMDADSLRSEVAAADIDRFAEAPEVSRPWASVSQGPWTTQPQPGPAPDRMAMESFDTLPVDDSHASKVMRAASAYATASKDWAQNLARVEKIKSELLKGEALLHEALVAKETSEGDLKTLVTGGAA